MDFGGAIQWLNENPGAAGIVAVLVAALITAVGWALREVLKDIHARRAKASEGASEVELSTLQRIMASKRMRIGVLDYPPLMTFSRTGETVDADGVFPRFLKHIANQEGLATEWVPLNWSELIEATKSGRVDMVASVFWTQRRSEQVSFCALLHRIGVTGVVREGETRINTHADLAHPEIRIGVVRGEIGWEYAIQCLSLAEQPHRFKVLDQYDIRSAADLVDHGDYR